MALPTCAFVRGLRRAKNYGTLRRAKRDYAHRKDYCFYRTVRPNSCASFFDRQNGEATSPNPTGKICRHITLFLGNSLLDIFKRQLIATLVPLLCQKCGRKSAELGKLTEVLEIVDNSMQ